MKKEKNKMNPTDEILAIQFGKKIREERLGKEYWNLRDNYNELKRFLADCDDWRSGITAPMCPIELLREQANVMEKYLHILETRAKFEYVDLFRSCGGKAVGKV